MQITRSSIGTQKGPRAGDVDIAVIAVPQATSAFVCFTPGARTAWESS
jgi:hypothetical protein